MNSVIDKILDFKKEMLKLGIEIKAIKFDENGFDLISRYMEKNCSKIISCENCPYIKSEIKCLGIEIKKG